MMFSTSDVDRGACQYPEDVCQDPGTIAVSDGEDMRRRAPRQSVDRIRHLAAGLKGLHDPDDFVRDGDLRLVGRRAHVVSTVHPRALNDGIRELTGSSCGLVLKDVESGADSLVADSLLQGGFVNHRAAGRIDEVRTRLHCAEELGIHQVPGLRIGGNVDGDGIGLSGDLERGLGVGDAETLGLFMGETAGPGDHPHAEGTRPLCHLATDLTQTDDAQRAPIQAARLGIVPLVPLTQPQVCHLVRNPAIAGQQQPHDQLGHRYGVLAGAVRDEHAQLGRGRNVDRVYAGPRPDDQRQGSARAKRVGVHLLASNDQNVRVDLPDQSRKSVGLDVGLEGYRASEILEPVDTHLLELVRN
jgi:hypothetical protein